MHYFNKIKLYWNKLSNSKKALVLAIIIAILGGIPLIENLYSNCEFIPIIFEDIGPRSCRSAILSFLNLPGLFIETGVYILLNTYITTNTDQNFLIGVPLIAEYLIIISLNLLIYWVAILIFRGDTYKK